MFLCSELDANNNCINWVDISTIFSVESGVGLQLGLMLLGVAVSAWCLRAVAMLILNR